MGIILQEKVLVCAVSSKRNAGNPKTGEEALEAVESAEGTGVSPCFTSWVSHGHTSLFLHRDGGDLTFWPRDPFWRRQTGARRQP